MVCKNNWAAHACPNKIRAPPLMIFKSYSRALSALSCSPVIQTLSRMGKGRAKVSGTVACVEGRDAQCLACDIQPRGISPGSKHLTAGCSRCTTQPAPASLGHCPHSGLSQACFPTSSPDWARMLPPHPCQVASLPACLDRGFSTTPAPSPCVYIKLASPHPPQPSVSGPLSYPHPSPTQVDGSELR